jgi:hypothetical protein
MSPLDQSIRKSRLPMVDVGDDAKISYVFLFHATTPHAAMCPIDKKVIEKKAIKKKGAAKAPLNRFRFSPKDTRFKETLTYC